MGSGPMVGGSDGWSGPSPGGVQGPQGGGAAGPQGAQGSPGPANFGTLNGFGPQALGSQGVASTVARSDQTAASYRSDLPLSTTWFIDPVSGSDAATNPGTTNATALATLQELKRRWWGAEITANTTITVLGNIPTTDTGGWNFTKTITSRITLQGSTGPTTGFGGRSIDNTLYSGSVTGFVAASLTPAADDIELTDSAIPVSFTASGLLAEGVLFAATSGTAFNWWAAKDLGSKTIRISCPLTTSVSQNMNQAIPIGTTYNAYQLWTCPSQNWGLSVDAAGSLRALVIDSFADNTPGGISGSGTGFTGITPGEHQRVWFLSTARSLIGVNVAVNCAWGVSVITSVSPVSQVPPSLFTGGMARSTGAGILNVSEGTMGIGGPFIFQGCALNTNDNVYCTVEQSIAFFDCSVPCMGLLSRSCIQFNPANTNFGVSGKGNSSKLVWVRGISSVNLSSSANPPWVAASTSDLAPIEIDATSYAISAAPVANGSVLQSGTVFPSLPVEATWPIANIRWYAVDVTNGLDTNAGYSDTSAADAGTKAMKTMAALAAIIPQVGNGRFIVIMVAAGTYATGLTFLSAPGYQQPLIIGTGTNATAGATAFAGNVADLSYAGAVPATGTNAAGYNPTGAATTVSLPCTIVGGGAPGFTADTTTSTLSGFRIRFDINTSTVALRNVSRMLQTVAATDTVTTGLALPATPSAADVFYIEQPGVVVPRYAPLFNINYRNGWGIAGFDFGTGAQTGAGSIYVAFCRFKGAVGIGQGGLIFCLSTPIHPTLSIDCGTGCRFEASLSDSGGSSMTIDKSYILGTLTYQNSCVRFLDAGSMAGAVVVIGKSPGQGNGPIGGVIVPGQGQPVRIINVASNGATAGIVGIDASLALGALVFANQGANPAIALVGQCDLRFLATVAGNTGGAGAGLDLTISHGSRIDVAAAPTVTGSADVKLANGLTTTWTALAATGLADNLGNRITSTTTVCGPLVSQSFTGSILGSTGAVLSYLADQGIGLAVNNTTAFRRPTSMRIAMRLRVTSISNNAAGTVFCTLYKNGIATVMQTSIPAGSAANSKFFDVALAHQILFADGDDYDIRLDDLGADVAAVVNVSASIEWAA